MANVVFVLKARCQEHHCATGCVTCERAGRLGLVTLIRVHNVEINTPESELNFNSRREQDHLNWGNF